VNLEAFLTERGPEWDRLEATLERAGGRPERLGTEGVLELGRGYRAAVADLALARRRYPGDPVVTRLERLVLAARQAVYGRRRRAGTLLEFATRRYWQLVAERPGILGLAALATVLPCILAGLWALHDPGAALGLVPGKFQPAAHVHVHKLPFGATAQATLASSIFTNNIQVTFLAFGGGLLLGAGSLAVLAYNAAILGALGGVTLDAGNFSVFVRYIVPHGILELSCFIVAGAAGLRLGWALIDAGTLPRGESLRRAARPAVGMILGTAPCLIVAGLTEGFITPRGLPLGAALAVGLLLGGGFWTLVVTRGRRVTAPPAASR
jgi:uncharacterized membrane protein SpoIIM required for sporulation